MSKLSRLAFLGVLMLSMQTAWADTAAAPTEPTMMSVDKISSGDTAWMLTSTALVLMMSIPGLALFYGGMVRKKNVLATLMQTFAVTCVVTLLWWLIGYSLAFTPGSPFLGGASRAFFGGMTFMHDPTNKLSVSHLALTIPETVYAMFQMTFAAITPALIAGAFADRMKFSAMLVFMAAWSLLVYSPIAHMVWEPTGWLNKAGVLDYAGGTVVHINAGIAGLASCLVLGKRLGYGREAMPPHNLTLTLIGASLLWVGWFGFNAGSALAAGTLATSAFVATHFGAAAAAIGWSAAEWIRQGKPSALGAISGCVAGLVAITPASGFVTPMSALWIGLIAGIVCYLMVVKVKAMFGYDDSLDAFGVHGAGGTLGAILTGIFANSVINPIFGAGKPTGLLEGNGHQVLNQLVGVAIAWGLSIVGTLVILFVVDKTVGLRVNEEDEREGLDLSQHGEEGYDWAH
jgi:Amt family ammonium transporter